MRIPGKPSVLWRSIPAAVALLLLTGAGASFSAAEWAALERETPRLDAAWGAAAGRAAACGERDTAARQQFYDFILRYLSADAAAKQLETFEDAEAAAQRAGCDRYVLARERARTEAARRRIEPILRDHGF
ncbi:MAG TPA: hypothetical protein VE397_18020 [Stellaceae bacterium]|nr:hypothetical protein [Stellaceae bacterium]